MTKRVWKLAKFIQHGFNFDAQSTLKICIGKENFHITP
jgi:hypothetical protein